MAKRDYPLHFSCSHPGCKEKVTYRYSTIRDLKDSAELRWYGDGRWKCLRHVNESRVLSAENQETRFEVVSDERPYGRFFGKNGLISGPGFLAYASDLPAGTKLIVTARIELPTPPAPGTEGE